MAHTQQSTAQHSTVHEHGLHTALYTSMACTQHTTASVNAGVACTCFDQFTIVWHYAPVVCACAFGRVWDPGRGVMHDRRCGAEVSKLALDRPSLVRPCVQDVLRFDVTVRNVPAMHEQHRLGAWHAARTVHMKMISSRCNIVLNITRAVGYVSFTRKKVACRQA